MSVDWSSLPSDLVRLILQKITKIQDNIRFCAVCKPWFIIGQNEKLQRMKTVTHNQPPLLLTQHVSSKGLSYDLYDVEEKKTYAIFDDRWFTLLQNSSFGWFGDIGLYLINPFSRKTMQLPGFPDCKTVSFEQVILSDDPSLNPNNYIMCSIVAFSSIVRILRSGDKAWTCVDLKNIDRIANVLFHKGHLYVLDCKDSLIKINLDDMYSDAPTVEYLIQRHVQHHYGILPTLVESVDGDILCIKRFDKYHNTEKFEVFKLGKTKDGANEPEWDWIKLESLGNQTLFVGYFYSKSVPSGDSLSPNSIYYAYIGNDGGDMGIFSLEDQSRHSFYDNADQEYLVPKWISPTLP